MTALIDIGKRVRDYADARDRLAEVMDEVKAIQRQAVRVRVRRIQTRVANLAAAGDAVREAIDANRDLFAKRRTQSLHGIKFGVRKQIGKIEGDRAGAIQRIDERMPERRPELVRTRAELNLNAMRNLSARELASLGVVLVDADDKIVLQAVRADHLEALVEKMLEDAEQGT